MSNLPTNLWRATAAPLLNFAQLEGETRADVTVIGGGIMGAITALTLAQSGVSVALIEAERIGEGASSRPGGFVVPHFTFAGPAQAIASLGATGERLVQAVGHSATRVFDLIKQHDIHCDAQQGGWYQPAAGKIAWDRVRAVAEDWQAHGFNVDIMNGEETRARTGVGGYTGSWMVPTGGTLHPLNYTIGLVLAGHKAGVRVYESTPATAITRNGQWFRITTPRGAILTERVINCTNAQANGLAPEFEKSIVRMKIWQCATTPIPVHERARLFKNGESLSDTRGNLFTYRFDRDWRLITGAVTAFGMPGQMAAHVMAKRLHKHLGFSAVPTIDYLWSGKASVTRSRLPEIVIGNDGIISLSACNGRGIALSTVLGEAVAKAVSANNFDALPAPVVKPKGGLDITLQQTLAPFYPYYSCVTDWLNERA
ncbi:NAD(P)/FAD-dependent oxidoreductase [Govanella unica]|uniref:FAD-binding oxidoreductase n=1 Tax=Govanella unica TaxID=2975056 RepID=A0A9X3TYU9_9PROT|nr:FAD-binding oxidoreductase [Govania unica]MDA5194138.1 FAD-binding oxidoreductase [Govania unica]